MFIDIAKKKKRGKFDPIGIKELLGQIKHFIDVNMPAEAVSDVIKWEHIHKSKCSLSFYNGKKTWTKTNDGMIRISDHWNFIATKSKEGKGIIENFDPNYIHSKTDIDITKKWAMGVYDSTTKIYKIVKVYDELSLDENKSKMMEVKNSINLLIEESKKKNPFPQELIDKRRDLKMKMIYDQVIYNGKSDIHGFVRRIGNRTKDGVGRKCIDVVINGEDKILFLNEIKDDTISISGEVYTFNQLGRAGLL